MKSYAKHERRSSADLYTVSSTVKTWMTRGRQSAEKPSTSRSKIFAALTLLLVTVLLLTACGPERRGSKDNKLKAATIRIAETFVQDGNAEQARNQLHELDVANAMQWLVYVAESAVDVEPNSEQTAALVDLAVSLGSQSNDVLAYAEQNGLADTKAPSASNAVAQSAEDSSVVPVQAALDTPAPAPTVQVIGLDPTMESIEEPAEESIEESTEVSVALPTATPEPAHLPTATSIPVPLVIASTSMNVRTGPGTAYPIVDDMLSGEEADIVARNADSDWWQVKLGGDQLGWVFGQLVSASGDLESVAIASDIPEPPSIPTPAPVVEQPPTEESPPPEPSGPEFKVIERRLWNVYENGGQLNGPSVTCGEKRQLVVNVVDANGVRINGVQVQAEFGAKEIFATGAQGKGDGVVEFILGEGQDVRVIRDVDGRDVTSEVARGMVTKPAGISYQDLIGAQYCTDDASCKSFVDAPGCYGHYSWSVTFQRNH